MNRFWGFYNYFRLMRPHHWIKNLLVFTSLVFGGMLFNFVYFIDGIRLFGAFSLLASAVYIINDIADKESDRLHPKKCKRPIASGECSIYRAFFLLCTLLLVVGYLSWSFPVKVLLFLIAYFILNLLYSFWLKRVVLIDIFLVSSLYILRIYAGGALWNIPVSEWLIVCTFFLSLFLITAKRRSEFCSLKNGEKSSREVINLYNKEFLDHVMTITIAASIVSYGLYVVSTGNPYLIFSLFLVVFGFFRYLYSVHIFNIGQTPELVLLKDPWIIFVVLAWGTYSVFVFYNFI